MLKNVTDYWWILPIVFFILLAVVMRRGMWGQ